MADYNSNYTGQQIDEAVGKALNPDSTPTAGSQALVTSGGAKSALNQKADSAELGALEQTVQSQGGKISTIEGKIPTAASPSNHLADKNFVNSTVATATATFRGTYNLVSDLGLTVTATQQQIAAAIVTKLAALGITADNNDYVFIQIPTANDKPTEIARVDRYKYNGSAWGYEWSLNNSSFTAAQWAAINSGITSALVSAFNAKYDKPSGGIPKTDLDSSVQTSLGKADTALQEHQDISGKADIAKLESGELIPALANNLQSWADRDSLSVEDTISVAVRTTAGSTSIDSGGGAVLKSAVSNGRFFVSAIKATGFNLLHDKNVAGTGYYFLVPKLEFGTFKTANKPNGILFTNSAHENLKPTVYFKPLSSGVPTSATDGTACAYTDSNGYRFFTTTQPGYMIVSGITIDSTCAHVAWSRRYDDFIAPTQASDAGSTISLSAIIHSIHSYDLMIALGSSADRIDFGATTATWHRQCDRVKPTWTTTPNEVAEGETQTYTHSATISGMKPGSVVDCDSASLIVDSTKVSYTDTSETAIDDFVYYELATETTGTATLNPKYAIEDFGLEILSGLSGNGTLTVRYARGYADTLAAMADREVLDRFEVLEERVGNDEAEINNLALRVNALELNAIDLSMRDNDGNRTYIRNTANSYAVHATGEYCIPLVYGNGIKKGKQNTPAWTRKGSTYTADFVNHLGNAITDAYIEKNDGCVPASAALLWQTANGVVTNVKLAKGEDCTYLQFTVSSVPTTNADVLLAVKDANGDVMWSWMIWAVSGTLGSFKLKNYTNVEYEMLSLPLGAIWNANRDHYVVPHFQWGRKDPMCPPSAYNSNSNMTLYDISGNTVSVQSYGVADDSDAGGTVRSVANSIKMPNKFFMEYDATNYHWNNLTNFNNFWNANETTNSSLADNQDTAIKTIYDPNLPGWTLPSGRFATGFTTTGSNTSTASQFNVIGSWSNGWNFKKDSTDTDGVYFPASGYRNRASGALGSVGSNGNWWSFAPHSQTLARYLSFSSGNVRPLDNGYRAGGFGVWPCRELN